MKKALFILMAMMGALTANAVDYHPGSPLPADDGTNRSRTMDRAGSREENLKEVQHRSGSRPAHA